MVEETSLEIGSQAHTLPERTLKSIFVQQRFMMLFQRGITLTVWRITPIRRSFAFGGYVQTYGRTVRADLWLKHPVCSLSNGVLSQSVICL
ncbi:hypothetical protein CEXT_344231 [Caerostris extrusa]|uniref:Uncharacterized protein n=1 Tax=Caerostris extrusa TaxID=172846 RepID=A0AAV4V3J7_CAEEX|nr:hypothetical protein CEXT_344231 [Caerostris extrusa]